MNRMTSLLDRIAAASVPRGSGCGCSGMGCTCHRCRAPAKPSAFDGWDEAPARHHAPPRARGRAARGATSGHVVRGAELRNWHGWSPPVTLAQIQAAQAQQRNRQPITDPLMRRMLARGGQVYRITRAGIDRDRALTIGATLRTGSIAERIGQHRSNDPASPVPVPGRDADPQVWRAIRNLPASRIYVQAGLISDRDRHNRRTKFYENWLQVRERPLIYNRDTTSFEEADWPPRRWGRAHGSACQCSGCCG